MTAGQVRVLVRYQAPGDDPEAVVQAYKLVCEELRGTPGLLGSELLASTLDEGRFAVLSLWSDAARFQEWEQGPAHKGQTSGLRPFRDTSSGRGFDFYEVVHAL
ncbi:antibiotic biosynthesis monooxygenase family protein [Actinomadura hibisca]|uniref:ORF 9 n=1 Tax=Actinomadura hibisca TaxID=68565 RepID=O32459_9ACTN|nr:antibiotic biosynthesis monooxygenase family protein [Actinomadura hibisca]ABM21755.1 PdmI [Actinomadura hibisca]BAA23152.1 unnamed protein product [Actinomadura hibisca]